MLPEEWYKKENLELQKCIRSQLEAYETLSEARMRSLIGILKELEKTLDRKGIPLCYPRIIVDSWEFEDELGQRLLALAALYEKWK